MHEFLDSTYRRVRHAVRLARRKPTLVLALTAIMAVGVGANAPVFDTLDRLLYRPMHVPQANQMVTLYNLNRKTGRYQSASFLDYLDFARARSLSGLTAYLRVQSSLTIDGTNRNAWTDVVTDNFFDVLRVPPATGNVTFTFLAR